MLLVVVLSAEMEMLCLSFTTRTSSSSRLRYLITDCRALQILTVGPWSFCPARMELNLWLARTRFIGSCRDCRSSEAPFCCQLRSRLFSARRKWQHRLGVWPRWRRAFMCASFLKWNCSLRLAGLRNVLVAHPSWSPKESLPSMAPSLAADSRRIPAPFKWFVSSCLSNRLNSSPFLLSRLRNLQIS